MLALSNVCRNSSVHSYLIVQVRGKTKTHWAKLKKKTSPKYKALNHFDDFYGSVFGKQWEPMREALFRKPKYAAVVNNYGDAEGTMEYLTNRGAHCLKNLMSVQQKFQDTYSPTPPQPAHTQAQSDSKLQAYTARLQTDEISSVYPENAAPERLDLTDITLQRDEIDDNVERERKSTTTNKNLEEAMQEAQIDESRVIDPSMGLTTEALYQYVPATKLKGMDDWVPESLHYSYYSKDNDFPLIVEPETEFSYPEHLKVYTYEMDSEWTMFPEPKRCDTGVFNYYPMDCGSIIAVLALCLAPGDRVLDLCSAPGGKALVALQTLLPDVVVCNDVSPSRCNRIKGIFNQYLFDFSTSSKWRERVVIKQVDGRAFVDDQGYEKVLVDVPCTTDRHSVNEDENNIFRPDRVKERLKIPELQSQLLVNALKLVKVGGAVVYSTCSLSPIQNDGVIHMALKYAFETHNIVAKVKDLTIPLSGLTGALALARGPAAPRYGQLVTPALGASCGPAYVARLVRVK